MNLAQSFQDKLQTSADSFAWGAEQVPPERRDVRPPLGLGKWTATRHVFHMMYYEHHVALPGMRQWLGGPRVGIKELQEKAAWGQGQDWARSLRGFREVRDEQIALLAEFDDAAWDEERHTLWGPVTLRWVVSKTCQHTAEHASNVLQIALFWDHFGVSGFLRRIASLRDARESR